MMKSSIIYCNDILNLICLIIKIVHNCALKLIVKIFLIIFVILFPIKQYLVVMTSRPDPLIDEPGWSTNGAGRKFSHKFGYGLMDASRVAELAASWRTLPQQHICQTRVMAPNAPIPDSVGSPAVAVATTDGCAGTLNSVRFLEHVQCKVSLRYIIL